MQHPLNNIFNAALVISGVKLIKDFSRFNLHSLEVLLANMQFFLKNQIPDHSIYLYTSALYKNEESTVVFINNDHYIHKVRYLNCNLAQLF